jgi:hypothetical protein
MINRRNFITGCGSIIALPYLESLCLAGSNKSRKRMIIVFSPNGMNMADWTPKDTGQISVLPPTLSTFKDYQKDIIIYSNLAQLKARPNGDGAGDHARSMSTFLTGVQIKKTDGSDIEAGISVDQLAAQKIGNRTKIPSLQLGCESSKSAGSCDSGYSCAYSSTISWASPSLPLTKDNNPRSVFETIYGNGESINKRKKDLRKSVLDYSTEQANQLKKKLSGNDTQKLDEYFDALRQVERKIQRQEAMPKELLDKKQYFDDIPEIFGDHAKVLIDLIILSFQTDSTRIATLVLANEGSNRTYKEININEGHHELSHHQKNEEKLKKLSAINKLHAEQVSYLFSCLKKTDLLNETIVAYGCGIEDGNSHAHHNLPILIGGGGITGGKHIVADKNTPLNNLWLGMLNYVGVQEDILGDSTDVFKLI